MTELICGIHPVREALRGRRRKPLELFLSGGHRPSRLEELVKEAAQAGVPVRFRERPDLDRLAGQVHHQGAVLRVEPFAYAELEDLLRQWRDSGERAFFLLLDGITDPHNFGAILRSAEAAGCQGVIVPRDRACPVSEVVARASAGALEHVLLCQVTNLARTLEALKKEGVWVYGLAGEEDSTALHAVELTGDLALVVGSEGAGLRVNTRNHCDQLLAIAMRGRIASLNASVAAGVALFEVVRQRDAAKEERSR